MPCTDADTDAILLASSAQSQTHQRLQPSSLKKFEVSQELRDSIFVIPEYVSAGEEAQLLTRLNGTKGWHQVTMTSTTFDAIQL